MITGASELMSVEWLTSDGTSIDSATDNYVPSTGAIESGNIQRATLVVGQQAVDQDKTFTCRVTSSQFPSSPPSETEVQLNVYGKFKSWLNRQGFRTYAYVITIILDLSLYQMNHK